MKSKANGILLLNKPSGITSFKALNSVKKQLKVFSENKIKVGHTGTLDRFAEGLLVVLTGKFTKLNPVFTSFDKSYEAVILFGKQTDTLDPEGEVIKTSPIPELSLIKDKIESFKGSILQRPPIFSAVHVNGERAWKKALKGEIEELPERKIRIDSFDILDWTPPQLRCRISCSKGTYIRSLARDIGCACGSCAHLNNLKRLTVGPFSVENSISAEHFNPENDLLSGRSAFSLLEHHMPGMFTDIEINKNHIEKIRHGVVPDDSFFIKPPQTDGHFTVFNEDDFIAYIKRESEKYSYIFTGL